MNASNWLARVEQILGRAFTNRLIGIEALNSDRAPIHDDQGFHALRRNDDLAIVGDKAIDMVLCTIWYRARDSRGLPLTKGNWSCIQQDLVSEAPLAARGFDLGLDAYVIKNPGHTSRISTRMMATALEAMIGAIFVDSGCKLEAVRAAMENLGFFEHQLLRHTDCTFLTDLAGTSADA